MLRSLIAIAFVAALGVTPVVLDPGVSAGPAPADISDDGDLGGVSNRPQPADLATPSASPTTPDPYDCTPCWIASTRT